VCANGFKKPVGTICFESEGPASDDFQCHHCENTAPEASRIRKVTAQGRFPGSRFIGKPAFPGVAQWL
jgi:hypothetical protein